ncbi:hypothetical protein KIH74_04540 [Kineosporia sp. J2-2]|uniref:Uncharacterized protein n=1 Tax=Kineosporia corallincola TaxID=2835133 RepID=A0ABS5TAS9_9ACTN|nr:hypothetical protein [Kineosporia corallincola]MBT0768177.1 hypothetical protein [Kineosporia corallincola]
MVMSFWSSPRFGISPGMRENSSVSVVTFSSRNRSWPGTVGGLVDGGQRLEPEAGVEVEVILRGD